MASPPMAQQRGGLDPLRRHLQAPLQEELQRREEKNR